MATARGHCWSGKTISQIKPGGRKCSPAERAQPAEELALVFVNRADLGVALRRDRLNDAERVLHAVAELAGEQLALRLRPLAVTSIWFGSSRTSCSICRTGMGVHRPSRSGRWLTWVGSRWATTTKAAPLSAGTARRAPRAPRGRRRTSRSPRWGRPPCDHSCPCARACLPEHPAPGAAAALRICPAYANYAVVDTRSRSGGRLPGPHLHALARTVRLGGSLP